MERKPIEGKTKKMITVRSGGYSYKNQDFLIEENSIIGEFAHIEADSPIGPRANPNNLRNNSSKNIILVTRNEHKIIDDQVEKYPVEDLLKLKGEHEKKIEKIQTKVKENLKDKSFF